MQKIKTLIVDDERLARNELISLLQKYKEIEIIGEAENGEAAIQKIENLKPELVFLDIQMPGYNGFEVLEKITLSPEVIFVTAYDEYALKAFEVNALNYLLKPVALERLDNCVKTLIEKFTFENSKEKLVSEDKIFIKDGEKCFFVQLNEIRLFESEGNYIRLYFDHSKPLVLKSLNHLEARLNEKEFFRTSRKHIVNLSFIQSVENWFNGGLRLTLNTGELIEVSRRQASKFKDILSL